jgi:hypothetical protein
MARNIGVNFNGKRIIHAGAFSRINADALNVVGVPEARKIVFLGTSEGGKPDVIHWFTNPSDARGVLRGGDLLKAGELAWNPSGDGVGAGEIGFLRVQSATQAELVKGNMTIKSKDYGAWTNQIQVKLEDGTTTGSKKVTVYHWKDEYREVFDDLGTIFDIQYTGTEAYASLTITQTGGVATELALKVGADQASATVVKSYSLGNGQWSDVHKLVADINDHVDFVASVHPNKSIMTDKLDAVADQDIKTSKYTVTALQEDIRAQLDLSSLIEVNFGTGTFPENFDYTFLSGGTNGTTPSSWAAKLDLLFGSGAYLVVPLTADRAIHSEVHTFVTSQSTNERSYMMGVYGGAAGETVDDIISRAVAFNNPRAVMVYPEVQVQTNDGSVATLPGYMTAALVAGRIAGKSTADPITLDYVNIVGVGRKLKTSDVERLLLNGVTPIEFVRRNGQPGYRIAQGITTYLVDGNPSFREISMVVLADELSSELVEILETSFAGGKGTTSVVSLIKNEVQSFLGS